MFFLRRLIPVLLVCLPLAMAPASAQELPDYVLDAYGPPPEIPEGPLAPEVMEALRVAFIELFETRQWGSDQGAARWR